MQKQDDKLSNTGGEGTLESRRLLYEDGEYMRGKGTSTPSNVAQQAQAEREDSHPPIQRAKKKKTRRRNDLWKAALQKRKPSSGRWSKSEQNGMGKNKGRCCMKALRKRKT